MDRLRPIQGRWSAALTRLGEIKAGENAVLLDETQALERRERTLMLAVPALAILAAALLGWRITRSITHPLAEAVALAQTVAAGNLAITAYSAGRDEPAQLTRALNDMATSLRSAIGTVHGGAQAIRIASAEIAEGNLDLSGRTENQASALEETAAAMEELTSTVQHNAANAERASGLAHSTADLAVRGGEEVGQMVSTMDDIDQAAHRITDITSVIDDIAFQTNLLALNAAVEAARAGEQGRGFAVVAGEVRNLAQRCAGAAREIKNLIGGTVTRVEDGVRLAGNAGATMTKVVDGIREVSTIMADISRAGKEQSIGIGQVNEAIASMDTVTQQNAALVEQASAAAASLRKEADQLATVVALFRLEAGATTIVAHRADARALLAPAAHGSAA